jgi:hypothetical protein
LRDVALLFAEVARCVPEWRRGLEGLDMTESQIANEWISRGEVKEARASLIRLLTRRLSDPVPADVLETINTQPSLAMLHDWFDEASTAATLADFIAVLRR